MDEITVTGTRSDVTDIQSESEFLTNAIAKFIIEDGYAVESVVESTPRIQEALPNYLENYEDRSRTWVAPDAHDKINAAPQNSS